MKHGFGLLMLVVALATSSARVAAAAEQYRYLPVTQLTLSSGTLPSADEVLSGVSRPWLGENFQPRAVLDGPGEIYLLRDPNVAFADYKMRFAPVSFYAAIRSEGEKAPSGRIFWPDPKRNGMLVREFTAPASGAAATSQTSRQFNKAKAQYYGDLARRGFTGTAWFRHQEMTARAAAGETTAALDQGGRFGRPQAEDALDETFGVFGGGRAVSENLQLDRGLMVAAAGEETVDLASIPGINTQAMDWSKLNTGAKPKIDALAAAVPADQHAIFFPSFKAMTDVIDEADREGTPVLHLVDTRSEDSRTREKMEHQLCLAADSIGRLIGPSVISSVALTGSDPYLRAGSDVAVLFAAVDPKILAPLLAARQELALKTEPKAEAIKGEIGGVAWQGVRSADRAVCSYMATVKDVVVVTNSAYLLERIIETLQGKTPALDSTGEMAYFRARYPLGEAAESGLLVLSDGAIRRWCAPRWRIGDSRRTRAAAALSELQACNLDSLMGGKLSRPEKVPGLGEITWSPQGPASSIYGSLAFMTPIAELKLEKATAAEAAAYGRFRENYQENWSHYFDPIAIRLTVQPGKLATDLTIMPLILGSEFNQFIALTKGGKIKPGAGDPHTGALLHLAMAINKESEPIRQVGSMMSAMPQAPGRKAVPQANPLGWLGSVLAVYLDQDPFWEELSKAATESNSNQFMEKNIARVPAAFFAEVSDGLQLAVFLTTLRGMVEQSAPGLTNWTTERYHEHPYVKVTVSEDGAQRTSDSKTMTVCYATLPHALVVSPNEKLIQRALDRLTSQSQAGAATTAKPNWLGEHLALNAGPGGLDLVRGLMSESYQQEMQQRAWSNLPILNEWHRLYRGLSPLAFHEKYWLTRPIAPGGGDYVWNEKWQTMESTVYGHPAAPKTGPKLPEALARARGIQMGVTFENEGLRGQVEINRE